MPQKVFLKFCVVGILNTGIDFAVFTGLFILGLPLLFAHILAYSCGIGNSFILNRKWTFKSQEKQTLRRADAPQKMMGQLTQFVTINLFSLTATYLLLVWFHMHWGWPVLLARLLAMVISLAINFVGSRFWVFRVRTD